MSEEADKAGPAPGAANETVVDGNRHEMRIVGALGAQRVETVDRISGELAGGSEPMIPVETVIIGFDGVRNQEVRCTGDGAPVGQLINEGGAVIGQASRLDEQAARIGAGTAGYPADWCRAEDRLECLDGKLDVGPLLILRLSEVVERAIVVAYEFVSISQIGTDEVGVAWGRARDGEQGGSDVEHTEETEKAPATDARAVFDDAFDDRATKVRIRGKADIVKCWLGGAVAFEYGVFSATFDIEIDIDGDAGVVGPSRVWRPRPATDAITAARYAAEPLPVR